METTETTMDPAELALLTQSLRQAMTDACGRALEAALTDLGWPDLLAEMPQVAIPTVFRLLGETGAHAPLINDVVLAACGRPIGGTVPVPYAGGRWIVWAREDSGGDALDEDLPIRGVPSGEPVPLSTARQAIGWWLLGSGTAMLELARTHALDRTQFGRPLASFQAVRHRLAETLVALEGAQAALAAADDDLSSLLAKAAAGQAAQTAARHCQQVLGGIGFTAEHPLHRHIRRALVLDGLLGSTRELIREAGGFLHSARSAPRLIHL